MSYGLIVKSFDGGGNEIIQLDTDRGLVNYVITAMGSGFSVPVSGYGKNRLVFIRPHTDSNGNYEPGIEDEVAILAGTLGGPVMRFVTSDYAAYNFDGFAWNAAYLPRSVQYIIMEDVTNVAPVGEYGLQVLTAGGESAFDSRKIKFNAGLRVTSIIPARALSGYGNELISSDASNYISAEWTFWDSLGSKACIIPKGGTQNAYHLDMDRDEPDPTDQFNPTYYYDNYGPIWIAKEI